MKILLVTEFFPTGKYLKFSGGVEARTYFIAKNLARKNTVIVLSSRTVGTPKKETVENFKVLRTGPIRNYSASTGHILSRINFIKDAISLAKQLDIEIVDGGNYIAHFIAKNIANSKKIPVVAWYPDVWLNNWIKIVGFSGIFGEFLERLNLFRGFDAYIAISKTTASKLKEFTNKKIHPIYCGVHSKEFKHKSNKFPQPTILCISRLVAYKNIKTLIFAIAHLSIKIKNLQLIIVGTGPETSKLKKLTQHLKISRRVTFMANLARKDLIKLYGSSHIFSLPSIIEGFGIATIEAAAAGTPYVNSNIPIHKEVTRNGLGGYLVDSTNPIAYSDKMQLLLKDKSLYRKKSEDVLKLSKYYDWEEITKQTEAVYLSLLKK